MLHNEDRHIYFNGQLYHALKAIEASQETIPKNKVIYAYRLLNHINQRLICLCNSEYATSDDLKFAEAFNENIVRFLKEEPEAYEHIAWITINGVTKCSKCGYIPPYDRAIDDIYCSPFCPNCGAKMDGES